MPGSARLAAVLTALALVGTACGVPASGAAMGASALAANITDVNCDGVPDLLFGTMTGDSPDDVKPARPGSVQVRYGGSGRVQQVVQDELGDHAPLQSGRFAGALLAADLNRDGCSDVVVSETDPGSGSRVWALWGSPVGISADRSSVLVSGAGTESLGWVMAFVPLPSPVLVVSEEGEARRSLRLYPVTADGSLGDHRTLETTSPVDRSRWYTDTFAASLSADGDLLAITSPEYSDEGAGYPGEVYLVRLLPDLEYRVSRMAQDVPGVPGSYRINDGFGRSVSVRDGRLAIGVPGAAAGGVKGAGQVQVYDVTGIDAPRPSLVATVDVASAGVPGGASKDAAFGSRALWYRPCDGVDGLLVVSARETSALSVPLSPSGTCPTALLTGSLRSDSDVAVSRGDPGAADTAAVLTRSGRLLLVTAGRVSDEPAAFAKNAVLASG